MPRIAASTRGTGLSLRSSENAGNLTNIKGKGVVDTKIVNKTGKGTTEPGNRSSIGMKRQAEESGLGVECNAKTRRRAALEEITNVSKAHEFEC